MKRALLLTALAIFATPMAASAGGFCWEQLKNQDLPERICFQDTHFSETSQSIDLTGDMDGSGFSLGAKAYNRIETSQGVQYESILFNREVEGNGDSPDTYRVTLQYVVNGNELEIQSVTGLSDTDYDEYRDSSNFRTFDYQPVDDDED